MYLSILSVIYSLSWPHSKLSQAPNLVQVCLYFVYLGIASFIASYAEVGLWMWTGESSTICNVSHLRLPCHDCYRHILILLLSKRATISASAKHFCLPCRPRKGDSDTLRTCMPQSVMSFLLHCFMQHLHMYVRTCLNTLPLCMLSKSMATLAHLSVITCAIPTNVFNQSKTQFVVLGTSRPTDCQSIIHPATKKLQDLCSPLLQKGLCNT